MGLHSGRSWQSLPTLASPTDHWCRVAAHLQQKEMGFVFTTIQNHDKEQFLRCYDDDIGGLVHLASKEEIRAGNGDGVFRPLQEVSWL